MTDKCGGIGHLNTVFFLPAPKPTCTCASRDIDVSCACRHLRIYCDFPQCLHIARLLIGK